MKVGNSSTWRQWLWTGRIQKFKVILLTTGLCTSQNALSWLSRIFLSILSLFLSTLWRRDLVCDLIVVIVQLNFKDMCTMFGGKFLQFSFKTYFACASACIKMNSHFLAKALCSLAKLSCKIDRTYGWKEDLMEEGHLITVLLPKINTLPDSSLMVFSCTEQTNYLHYDQVITVRCLVTLTINALTCWKTAS